MKNLEAQILPLKDSQRRLDICKKCEELESLTKICKKCYCVIPLKVKFDLAQCPLDKW